jgi:hypothetical protein
MAMDSLLPPLSIFMVAVEYLVGKLHTEGEIVHCCKALADVSRYHAERLRYLRLDFCESDH